MPPQALTASSSVATPALFAKLCIAFIVVHLSKTSVKTPCLTSRLIDKFTEAGGAQVPNFPGLQVASPFFLQPALANPLASCSLLPTNIPASS
jgi:hypothetical protein